MPAAELFSPQVVWIGSPHPFDLHEVYLDFRSPASWALAQAPARAELRITADSRYRLWINGHFAGRGPGRGYPWRQVVDCLDVTAYLRAGANTLAVQVYQPGYSHFAYVHRGAAGLLAELSCDGQRAISTDANWRVRRNPSFADLVPRVSIYGSGVEVRDLRLEDDWLASGYDASGWATPRVVAPVGGAPWTGLQPRELPLLVEDNLPLTLVETRAGSAGASPAESQDGHIQVRALWPTAQVTPIPQDADGWWRPTAAPGAACCWLFDLGRDHTCQGWAEIEGAGGDESLLVSYAEKLRDGQLVLSDPATYCRVRLTDAFGLRPGSQRAETFSLRGGRYLLFVLTGPTAAGLRIRFHARAAHYPLAVTRPLVTGDAELDGIVALCENTFRACLQDGFVDSTWRESSQWLGDALPQALIMAAMSEDLRPLRQVLTMAAEGAYADGVLPSVLPGEVHAYAIVDYNFMWVELLALYHRLAGSEAILVDALWPAMTKMLARFHQDIQANGLLLSQPGRRLFLDWAPVSRQEPSAIYNLHYLVALQTAAALARATGRMAAAENWQVQAAAVQQASRAAFWDGACWWDDLARTTCSQLAAALAILTQTASATEAPALLDAIAARSLDLDDTHTPGGMVLASPFMHHYLLEALRLGDRGDAVVEIIRRRWGRWVKAGYPTTWENWNVDFPDGSQCHAFSAHPRYHLSVRPQSSRG